ncbi:MAG: hypothetical protein CTY31_10705 [Hyphomicrobium sp.]|nr:MAG: hypothetical protein CTY31_10705 [Hyphomicrobium sp.]
MGTAQDVNTHLRSSELALVGSHLTARKRPMGLSLARRQGLWQCPLAFGQAELGLAALGQAVRSFIFAETRGRLAM